MKVGLLREKIFRGVSRCLGVALILGGLTLYSSTAEAQTPNLGDALWTVEAGSVSWLLDTGNGVRGAAYNPATGNILVASRAGGINIQKVDRTTGESSGSLDVDGIAGGTLPLNRIAVTEDGQIFATNLILDTGNNFRIYYWADEDADVELLFEGNPSPFARYGDGIGISGSGNDVWLFVSGTFTNAIAAFHFDGTDLNPTATVINLPSDGANASIAPLPDGTAWINGRDNPARLIDLDTGAVIATIPTTTLPASYGDIAVIQLDGRNLMVAGVPGTTNHNFLVLDVTDPSNIDNVRVIAETGSIGVGENTFRVGAVAANAATREIYVLATNVALAAYSLPMDVSVDRDSDMANNFVLNQNYPNPFNPSTNISFELPTAQFVTLNVYNMLGQQVASIINENVSAGSHTVQFNATDLSSGIYIYRLQAGDFVQTKRMSLIK